MKIRTIASVVMAAVFSLAADQLKLNDSSVIFGKVTKIAGGKVTINNSLAGDITVDVASVAEISTDEDVNVATETGKTSGKFQNGAIGETKLADVKNLWRQGDPDPTLPPPPQGRKWTYEAFASIDGKTGNTEKCTVAGGIKATLAGPDDKLLLYLNGKHARDSHVTTEKEVIGGADFERQIAGTHNSWYARSEYEYDKINDIDPSITTAVGYGYYIVKEDDMQIRLRAGLTHVYRDYVSDKESESEMGMELNYHHEIKLKDLSQFTPLATFITDISYLPLFDDMMDNYHIKHESSIEFPINTMKSLTLRLGVMNDYYSEVAPEKEHLDTTYFAKLVLTWE